MLFTSGLALPVQAATAQGIYAIKPNGDLFYYQYLGGSDGANAWGVSGVQISNGWNFRQVFSGGDGAIFAITEEGEVTKIPTNGIAVEGTMFLHYIAIRQWLEPGNWTANYASLAYSDNQGQDWVRAPFYWAPNGNFAQVAFARDREIDWTTGWVSNYIYMCGWRRRSYLDQLANFR